MGTTQVDSPHNENSLRRVMHLLDAFRPDMVAVEDCSAGSPRSGRAPELISGIKELARSRRVRVGLISRKEVQKFFTPARGKYAIAEAIATIFPELKRRLPRKRQPWMSEDERMNIFDAVGLALVCLHSVEAQAEASLPVINF